MTIVIEIALLSLLALLNLLVATLLTLLILYAITRLIETNPPAPAPTRRRRGARRQLEF